MSVEAVLKSVSFFSSLSGDQLRELARIGQTRSLEADNVVFAEGDLADGLYVILAGKVKVFGKDPEGNEIEFSALGKGDFFGEMALLDGKPRSATVSCTESCDFFILGRKEFLDFLAQSAHLMAELLAGLSQRVRVTNEKFFTEMLRKQRLRAEMEIERHRSLAQMVAGVAHEINTPLGIVNSAVSIIAERLDSETASMLAEGNEDARAVLDDLREAIRLMQANITKANRLILSFKNLSVRQITDTRERVNLSELMEEILDLFRIQARLAHLQLEVKDQLSEEAKEWDGYPGYLSQVMMNLLSNIERYAYPGGSGGKVEIVLSDHLGRKEPCFRVSVRDFGCGIPPEDRPKIFEPFFTTGRDRGGSGLGLAIVHNIVTSALKGTIEVESEEGRGTAFHLTFPCTIPESVIPE